MTTEQTNALAEQRAARHHHQRVAIHALEEAMRRALMLGGPNPSPALVELVEYLGEASANAKLVAMTLDDKVTP